MPLYQITKKKSDGSAPSKKTYKITKKVIIKPITKPTTKLTNEESNKSLGDKSEKYLPKLNLDIVHPKYWELPNRKHFYNWIIDTFGNYEIGNAKKQKPYKKRIPEHFDLSNIQRLTRDYLQGDSPTRGLLLYLGLGVGKTCSALTVAEAILTKKQVVIFSKASLENNWVKEIKQCSSDYLKNHNYWVFKRINDNILELAKEINIPPAIIRSNDGVFLIDFTQSTSNFNELSGVEREKLDKQISASMDERFEFVHTDNPRLWDKFKPESINNKIIIWDEVHNLGSILASKSDNAERYYNMFMNAIGVKLIFLSGTPIINRIFEITKIFNILRGYMNVLEIQFKSTFDTGINYDKIKYALKQNKHIDQIIINKAKKIVKITKNPDDFITLPDNKGLVYKPEENISNNKFREQITKIIDGMGYKTKIEWVKPETCFPEDEEIFEQLFYNRELNKIKRMDLIKRRIAGLTSYYEYQDRTNYPELKPINLVQVPMSEYQFGTYERFRHMEIEDDKHKRRGGNAEEEELTISSYRIKSRLACTFVFPEEIGNPYDAKTNEDNLEFMERLDERLSNFGGRPSVIENMKEADIKKKINEGFITVLEKSKAEYLDINNGSLAKYSPKFLSVVLNIKKQAPVGKILIYSQFRNLIGLVLFSNVLRQTGQWAPFRIKKVNKMWELDEREDEKGKYKYIFYTGGEDKALRDIYIKVFNSNWDTLGSDCENLIKQLKKINANNYYGEIIKCILTTKTGAEGLDLKEVRFINILESYWQDVLIQQVIGRGVRNKSHLNLPVKDRNVEVFIYMATIPPNLVRKISYIDVRNDTYKYPNPALPDKANKVVSSDEHLYLIAQRKKIIINEFQRLMKESAFDCTLNYAENKLNPVNKNLVCMDYPTKNRDDYLYTPAISDTEEGLELAQEKIITVKYGSFPYKGINYYFELVPNASGKMYIYDENLSGRVRLPKPVGETIVKDGKRSFLFYAKKKKGKK